MTIVAVFPQRESQCEKEVQEHRYHRLTALQQTWLAESFGDAATSRVQEADIVRYMEEAHEDSAKGGSLARFV
jgi:hypothetical protein